MALRRTAVKVTARDNSRNHRTVTATRKIRLASAPG